ncbi:hypothetical protein U1Q18_038713 [Sarracenia purpurea var. burkii]
MAVLIVSLFSELFTIFHFAGDSKVLFADRVLKFTASGKMKRRILLVTDFAIYVVDPERDALKRRIALAAVDKLCLSELSDNFFAIVIPTEYDLLMASTRKIEIVTVFVEAIKSTSDYELEVVFSNRAAESTGFQNSRSRTEQEQGGSTESQRSNRVTNGSRGLLLVIAQAGATVCWWSQRGLVVARADATGFGGRDWVWWSQGQTRLVLVVATGCFRVSLWSRWWFRLV